MQIVQDRPAELSVTITPGANTAGTITLPAVAGKYHYITALTVQRTCTATLAGSAALSITTGNLPGSPQFQVGNAITTGATQNDVALAFSIPVKSSVVNTNTTIVFPQPGAAVGWNATCWYMVGD